MSECTRCDLVELCQRVLDAYTAIADLTLTFECMEKSIEVKVDAERISQVLIKLLSNARQYSPQNSTITITLQRTENEAIVMVRDNGLGITGEMLPHIFERFYHTTDDENRTSLPPRLGLGLYISQKIVEQHGGHIEVQSSPGSGSTFSVVLPLLAATTTNAEDNTALVEHESSPFQPPEWLVS